jgi:hypothetical protein
MNKRHYAGHLERTAMCAPRRTSIRTAWRSVSRICFVVPCLLLPIVSGCNEDRPTSTAVSCALQLQILPPQASDSTQSSGGVAERTAAGLRHVQATAYQIVLPESTRVLAATAGVDLPAGQNHYQLILLVPPAELYRVEVIAEGVLGGSGNPSEFGVLFAGHALVPNVGEGSSQPVVIQTATIVPRLSIVVTPRIRYQLSWTDVAGTVRYRLKKIPPLPDLPVEIVTTRTDTIIDFPPTRAGRSSPVLQSSGHLAWRIRAELSDSLFSAFSESVGVDIPQPRPPDMVRDLTVIGTTPHTMTLAWTAPGEGGVPITAESYDIRFSPNPISNQTWPILERMPNPPHPSAGGLTDSATVSGLDPLTTYNVALTATDAVGLTSAISNVATGRTGEEPPLAPTDLTAQALSDSTILLTWLDHAVNDDFYEVERKSEGDPLFLPRATLPGAHSGTVTYTDPGLAPRSTYAYRVRARNTGGPSDYSNEAEAVTLMEPPVLSAANGFAPDSIALAWRFAQPDPDGFLLERAGPTGDFTQVARPGPRRRSHHDGGLQPLTTYRYRVRAVLGQQVSPYSNVLSATTPDFPAQCLITPSAIHFGELMVGTSADSTFVVKNTGGGSLTGSVTEACAGFSLVSGGGTFSLGAGKSKEVTVRYQPRAAGDDTCAVRLGTQFCPDLICIGTATPAPLCSLSSDSLDFGQVLTGSQTTLSFQIVNVGGGILSGAITQDQGCAEFLITAGGGPFQLSPQKSRSVTVVFAPVSVGSKVCAISTGLPGCPTVTCLGSAELSPQCDISPSVLEFGTVLIDQQADRTFRIRNAGGGTVSGTVAVGTNCSDFSLVQSGGRFQLGPDDSVVVTVRFSPTTSGAKSCTVNLTGSGCANVACTGTGEAPPHCLVDPTILDFGRISPATSALSAFTITNDGEGQLVGSVSLAADCPAFGIRSGAGPFALGAGQSLLVEVEFYGTVIGTQSCEISLDLACPPVSCTGTVLAPDDHWASGYGSTANGMNSDVEALASSSTTLYAGGDFSTAGPTPASLVAAWNGAAWSDLDGGIYGNAPRVSALSADPSTLYAGGDFTAADDHSARNIAAWNGAAWSALSVGTTGTVNALAAYNGALYVGGEFTQAGGRDSTSFIAGWNGSIWSKLRPATPNGPVQSLTVFNNQLVAGGAFSAIGFLTVNHIASWNGGSWYPLGTGLDPSTGTLVNAMTVYNNQLIVGGHFTTAGTTAVSNIARWDGHSWSPLGLGLNNTVYALTVYHGDLIAAGAFTTSGSTAVAGIARWNGSVWSPMGSGLAYGDGTAIGRALATYLESLYVGGSFTTAGGKASLNIARWDDSPRALRQQPRRP